MQDDELDDELTSHLEFQVRKYMAAGMSEAEARRRARLDFGGLDQTKEAIRDLDPWLWLDAARRNVKYAARSLAKTPGFTVIAITILAVGIGANSAVFSLVNALLLRPLDLPRPGELERIATIDPQGREGNLPSTILEPLKKLSTLRGACGFTTGYEAAQFNGAMENIGTLSMSADCFQTLGIGMQLGRALGPSDDRSGAESVAVITARVWRTEFGARRDVLGKRIDMPGASFTVVGVAEDRFQGLLLGFPAGIVIPLHQQPAESPGVARNAWYFVNVVGRRAPLASEAQLRAEIAASASSILEQSVPPVFNAARRARYTSSKLGVVSARNGIDYFLRRRFGEPLFAVFGICAAILAIACVNLANLMVARSLRRRREVAVRLAIGGRRAQVAGMLALEGVLIVLTGAAASIPFGLAVDRLVVEQGAAMFGNFNLSLRFDHRAALFFAVEVAAIAAVLALAAAWQTRRLCGPAALHEGGRGVVRGGGRAQKILVAVQIALTLALVANASLFGSSLRWLYGLDLGVRTDHVWDVMLSQTPEGYKNLTPATYYRQLVRELQAVPGVTAATVTDFVPFYNGSYQQPVAALDVGQAGLEVQSRVTRVGDGFFGAMGMTIEAGRDFRQADGLDERYAIVSRSLAARFGSPESMLGRHIRIGASAAYQRLTVIGIASDAQFDLSDPNQARPPAIYIDSWQEPNSLAAYPVVIIKATGELSSAAVRKTVDRLGREYVERIRSLPSEIDGALVENRLVAYLSGAFGLLALVLAATGLFGLLSYQVANRTGEIGIRMALGARRAQIQWLIIRQIGGLLVLGCAAGIGLAVLAGRAIAGLLFGVTAYDGPLMAVSTAVLGATALAAAWLPSRRAATVDPLVALRHD